MRMYQAEYLTRMKEMRITSEIFHSIIFKQKDSLKDIGADGKMILKYILRKKTRRCELVLSSSQKDPLSGFCEYDNEPSASEHPGGGAVFF
jgi:hypothetical protein